MMILWVRPERAHLTLRAYCSGKEGSMAAPLTDEGRFPAVQKITKAEYTNFVTACNAPAQPSPGLVNLLMQYKKAK
jgi:hypothetical protein